MKDKLLKLFMIFLKIDAVIGCAGAIWTTVAFVFLRAPQLAPAGIFAAAQFFFVFPLALPLLKMSEAKTVAFFCVFCICGAILLAMGFYLIYAV